MPTCWVTHGGALRRNDTIISFSNIFKVIFTRFNLRRFWTLFITRKSKECFSSLSTCIWNINNKKLNRYMVKIKHWQQYCDTKILDSTLENTAKSHGKNLPFSEPSPTFNKHKQTMNQIIPQFGLLGKSIATGEHKTSNIYIHQYL